MSSFVRHILPLFAVIVLASCGKNEAEVIPRGKMAEIYAEMLMTDQWISSTPGMRMIADTSLVYEPILEKYGYDNLDYLKSVDHYMNDPERFSRILRTSGEILDKRMKELRRKQRRMELEEEALQKVLRHKTDYSFEEYFPYLGDEPYVHYYDSVTFELDSCKVYCLVPIETADTLYDRLRMIIQVDTLAVSDSLQVADSLALTDSLEKVGQLSPDDKPILKDSLKARIPRKLTPVMSDSMPMKMGTDRKKVWR